MVRLQRCLACRYRIAAGPFSTHVDCVQFVYRLSTFSFRPVLYPDVLHVHTVRLPFTTGLPVAGARLRVLWIHVLLPRLVTFTVG